MMCRVAMLLVVFLFRVDGYGVGAIPADTLLRSPQIVAVGFKEAHSMAPGARSEELLVSDRAAGMVYLLDLYAIRDRQDTLDVQSQGRVMLSSADFAEGEAGNETMRPGAMVMVQERILALVDETGSKVLLFEVQTGQKHTLEVPAWAGTHSGLRPVDLAGNELGELFVLDGSSGYIHHFNANADYLQPVILDGVNRPTALEYAKESLFVSESDTERVHVFTERGWFLARIGRFPELHRIRVYDQHLWVISGKVLHVFDLSGQHLFNMRLSGVDEPVVDIRAQEHDLLLMTSSSLYYIRMSQLPLGP